MNKYLLPLITIVLCLCGVAYPQSGTIAIKIDSLEVALKTADRNQQAKIMMQIINLSAQIAPEMAFVHAKHLLNTDNGSTDQSLKLRAANFLVSYYERNGKMDSAVYYLNLSGDLLQKSINQQFTSDNLSIKEIVSKNTGIEKPASAESNSNTLVLFISATFLLASMALLISLRKKKKQQDTEAAHLFTEIESLKTKIHESEMHTESEINKRTAELNEKLSQSKSKGLELKIALKKAEDANYLKNAFLGIISHQIRTPLNGIIGFSSLLETELSLLENKTLYEYAEGIEQSGDRLLNLLNNIIDISKIEAHDIDIEFHPCNIDEIINNIFELYVFSANEKGLAFKSKLTETPRVIADNAKLMRVIHIIVDNAIKYTNAGFVNITTGFVPDTNEVMIRVKDTGVGIEASYQEHLFEAFRQESSGFSRSYQGAGLGLPLAKRLLDLMHGRIEINSMHNVGTTIDIFIPSEKTLLTTKSFGNLQNVNVTPAGKLDIFIVEDDRMNRMVLQKILQKTGQVTVAVDGDETMKIISERYKKGHLFQVMLFDINLPSPWDGIKLMQAIRADYKEYRFIPFIAQTAYAMSGDREKMLEAGFDDYLAKPINKNELMTIIKNQLEKFKGINA
jgi:signal transduction histidine kinase/ActR/RegA family two-component response regulator